MVYGLFVSVLLVISAVVFIRSIRPIPGLEYITVADLQTLSMTDKRLKLVDIRDAVDYYEGHVQEAVNIYVGRMPFVWSKQVEQGDKVVLIGDRPRTIRRAARILWRKARIRPPYAILYTGRDEGASSYRHAC